MKTRVRLYVIGLLTLEYVTALHTRPLDDGHVHHKEKLLIQFAEKVRRVSLEGLIFWEQCNENGG